jgi:hypothetical protein
VINEVGRIRKAVVISGGSWSRSQVVRKYSVIKSPNNRTTMLRHFNNNNMPLRCETVNYLFYVPPILVVWPGRSIRHGLISDTMRLLLGGCEEKHEEPQSE